MRLSTTAGSGSPTRGLHQVSGPQAAADPVIRHHGKNRVLSVLRVDMDYSRTRTEPGAKAVPEIGDVRAARQGDAGPYELGTPISERLRLVNEPPRDPVSIRASLFGGTTRSGR
jgi:hypothetical protein